MGASKRADRASTRAAATPDRSLAAPTGHKRPGHRAGDTRAEVKARLGRRVAAYLLFAKTAHPGMALRGAPGSTQDPGKVIKARRPPMAGVTATARAAFVSHATAGSPRIPSRSAGRPTTVTGCRRFSVRPLPKPLALITIKGPSWRLRGRNDLLRRLAERAGAGENSPTDTARQPPPRPAAGRR